MVNQRNNAIAESAVAFYSAGGHSHDGINSSIIDTTKYSIFDFSVGRVSTNSARVSNQDRNIQGLKDFIISTVNSSFLEPSGIVLQDNIINARNIISGSITAEEIAANTITANNIAAATITGDLIAAGTITADLLAANAIVANSISIGPNDYWADNGYFRLGGTTGISYNGAGLINIGSSVYISGDISGASGTFSGGISATTGNIAGWTINSQNLTGGGTFLYSNGTISANAFRTDISSNARIEMGPGVGNPDELYFYHNASNYASIRNPGDGSLRISATGGTYTFGSQMSTSRDISVGGITGTSLNVGSPAEFIVLPGSYVRSSRIYNTATTLSPNMYIETNFSIYRSTSSIKYKTDVQDLIDEYAKKALSLRPVFYRSLCKDDNKDYSHYGFIAEEVAEIEPRLVHWGVDENGDLMPEGVQYERIIPHLVYLIKDLYKKNEELTRRIEEI